MKKAKCSLPAIYALVLCLLIIGFASGCRENKPQSPSLPVGEADVALLSELIRKNPQNDSLVFLRAKLFMAENILDSAIADLQKAISLNGKNPDYYSLWSEASLLANDSKTALHALDTALSVLPDHVQLLQEKVRLQLILRQYMEGMATLDHLFLIDPQNAYGYYLAGHIFIESGDTGRAVNSYQKAVDIDPELRQAWIQLGDVLSHMKNPICIRYYDNALRIDSSDIETRHNKAYALQMLGRIEEAIAQYRDNISRDSSYELSYYNLGILYKNRDSLTQAIEMLSGSIALNPEEASTWYARGECHAKLKNKPAALEDFKKASALRPEETRYKKAIDEMSR